MTRMRVHGRKLIGTGIALAATFAAFAVAAQEADDLEPAVDTSAVFDEADALQPAVDTSARPAATEEPDAVVAQDVMRRESSGGVMDEMTLGRTEITGNQELPKVLYIVPWQKSNPGDLTGKPVNSLLDEVLAPLDREEFIRQVGYYDDLYGENE